MQQLLSQQPENLTTAQLVMLIVHLNKQYRSGNPVVSDDVFDHSYIAELSRRNPDHPYLTIVQPEPLAVAVSSGSKGRIAHPDNRPMLSTQKAYSANEVDSWIQKCQQAAIQQDIDPSILRFRVTPKLDGVACRTQQRPFLAASRGDGKFGRDLTHLFDSGVSIIGNVNKPHTVGELVMPISFFSESKLSDNFAHPRNLVSGIVTADKIDGLAAEALKNGGVHYVIYDDLSAPSYSASDLIHSLTDIEESVLQSDYPLDGIVLQLDNSQIFKKMGHNNHHWHAQLAKKTIGETATVKVTAIKWATGRTQRISPIVQITPVELSGAKISNVTAHHAGYVREKGIGAGAVLSITRSGEIIPKILDVVCPADPELPDSCPCCNAPVEWRNDFLYCTGAECSAQATSKLQHFAKTTQMDLIGAKTAETLVDNGVTTIQGRPLRGDFLLSAALQHLRNTSHFLLSILTVTNFKNSKGQSH